MTDRRDVSIRVPVLARVEGEGALELDIAGGEIRELKLRIFEPPRLFEKLLEGRSYTEVPDIVARICGICPVAYQMSAVQALESLFGVEVTPWVLDMRRAMYCGEWIESHALHIHLLAAPDFLGFDSALTMAAQPGEILRRGLRLQGLGNELIKLFGGRSVHPVGVRVGGFHHAPDMQAVRQLAAKLRAALPEADALLAWTASLPLPEDDQPFLSVALRPSAGYPMYTGRIASSAGHDLGADTYAQHFRESHVPHSTALYSHLDGVPYLVGPLARLNLNADRLPAVIRDALAVALPSRNLFHSIVARAAEIRLALEEAANLLEHYRLPDAPAVPVVARAGIGFGATEARHDRQRAHRPPHQPEPGPHRSRSGCVAQCLRARPHG
jgi:sulfhydrogenase subunit alpha